MAVAMGAAAAVAVAAEIRRYGLAAAIPQSLLDCMIAASKVILTSPNQRGISCFGQAGLGHLPPVVLVWL